MRVLWLIFAVLASQAYGHDAPKGWSYPFACCAGNDCRPVPGSAILETDKGYVIARTGEPLAYNDTRIKDSPDGEIHWCSVAGKDDSRTICLFMPPKGM